MEATFKGATPLNLSKPVYEVVQIGPPSSFITPRKMRADKEGCNLSPKILMRFKRIKNLKGTVTYNLFLLFYYFAILRQCPLSCSCFNDLYPVAVSMFPIP